MSAKNTLKKYTPAELAESFVFRKTKNSIAVSSDTTSLLAAARKLQEELSEEEKIEASVMQLRFQIEDYLQSSTFDERNTFAYFLRKYIKIVYKNLKDFAKDIHLDESELSQILNGHRKPNEKTFVRFELHSNKLISAVSWYKLFEKEREFDLLANNSLREEQAQYVRKTIISKPDDAETL